MNCEVFDNSGPASGAACGREPTKIQSLSLDFLGLAEVA